MSWSIGLHMGDSVLEIAARRENTEDNSTKDKPIVKFRTLTTHNSMGSAITQFLAENQIERVAKMKWVSHLPQKIIESGHGSPTGFLTTSGFENLLEMAIPRSNDFLTVTPAKNTMPIERDLIFGIDERVNAQGHIEKLVREEELEFLASKLEMHKIKNVAIGFLHSNRNQENEKRAGQILKSKGFQVYLSSDVKNSTEEIPRFWNAVLNAYLQPYFKERLETLYNAFLPVLDESSVCTLADRNIKDYIDGTVHPLHSAFSLSDHLAEHFARATPLFYCGLEEFIFFGASNKMVTTWGSNLGPVAQEHFENTKMKIQPLTKLGRGFFSELSYTDECGSFDPGPMVMGRGLTPTLFDLLHKKNDCSKIAGVGERLNERGLTRLRENLFAYSRNIYENRSNSEGSLATNLLEMAARAWRAEIEKRGLKDLVLCGPLAPMIKPWLGGQTMGDDFFLPTSLLLEKHSLENNKMGNLK